MADQGTLFEAPPEFDPARLREHEADFTPLGVVRQFVDWLCARQPNGWSPLACKRILDPSAGAGAYGAVLRARFPRAHLTAIELRPEERPHLERHYDEVIIGDARVELAKLAEAGRRFDLIATNPPFTLLVDLLKLCLPLLGDDAVLALFGLTQWGQAEDHHETLDQHRPFGQARVGGRVRFRSGLNPKTGKPWSADAREYCHWVWSQIGRLVPVDPDRRVPLEHEEWFVWQLPPLPAEDRAWTIRPGTEEA